MRKKFFLILFIVPIYLFSFSIKLDEEFKIKRINNSKYNLESIRSLQYSIKNATLFAIIPDNSYISMYQMTSPINNFFGVFAFNKNIKTLTKIGKFNSFDLGGIINPLSLQLINEILFVKDVGRKKTLAFSIKDKYKLLYEIVPKDKYQDDSINFVNNNFAFALTARDNTFKNYKYRIKDYSKVAVYEIKDTNKPYIKETIFKKKISYYKKYFFEFWNNKNLLENKLIKNFIKYFDNFSENFALTQLYPFYQIGPPIIFSRIQFNKNDFYIISEYGTEIKKYSTGLTLIDSLEIKKYHNLKLKEIEEYKRLLIKKLKKKKQLKKFTAKYQISYLRNMLLDKKENNMLLFYKAKEPFLSIANLPKADSYLLVYSLDKRKAISDFIPIDFTPVAIDSEKRELIGVQQRNGDIYLQFYKWDY